MNGQSSSPLRLLTCDVIRSTTMPMGARRAIIMVLLLSCLFLARQLLSDEAAMPTHSMGISDIQSVCSGRMEDAEVLHMLGSGNSKMNLALVSMMHVSYFKKNLVLRGLLLRLPQWRESCPEVYISAVLRVSSLAASDQAFLKEALSLDLDEVDIVEMASVMMQREKSSECIVALRASFESSLKTKSARDDISLIASSCGMIIDGVFREQLVLKVLGSQRLIVHKIFLIQFLARNPGMVSSSCVQRIRFLADTCPVESVSLASKSLLRILASSRG